MTAESWHFVGHKKRMEGVHGSGSHLALMGLDPNTSGVVSNSMGSQETFCIWKGQKEHLEVTRSQL